MPTWVCVYTTPVHPPFGSIQDPGRAREIAESSPCVQHVQSVVIRTAYLCARCASVDAARSEARRRDLGSGVRCGQQNQSLKEVGKIAHFSCIFRAYGLPHPTRSWTDHRFQPNGLSSARVIRKMPCLVAGYTLAVPHVRYAATDGPSSLPD